VVSGRKCFKSASSPSLKITLIKVSLFFVALLAHLWLWEQWSLDESINRTGALFLASLLLLILLILPVREILKKRDPRKLTSTYWVQGLFYFYILVIVILSAFSFAGLIKFLLPIKVALLALNFYFRYKLRGSVFSKR
jgi:hypothetical protein